MRLIKRFIPASKILAVLICIALLAVKGHAEVSVSITNQNGEPLENTTLVLTPLFDFSPAEPTDINIDQLDQEFVPRVSVVQTHGNIYFPNQDQIRHHVYSFSEAKQFDIPLYSGTPAEPINFDRPGVVVLGCNIHDQMRGYILVSDSPYFDISDAEGQISILLDHPGPYELSIWHPEESEHLDSIEILVGEDLSFQASFAVTTARLFLPRRGSSGGDYF